MPRLKDETEIQRQVEAKQQEIAAYRANREQVEAQRELDRQLRNQAKIHQLDMAEQLQVATTIISIIVYLESTSYSKWCIICKMLGKKLWS